MSTRDLLIELGTEELPPKALQKLSDAFKQGIEQGLAEQQLTFANSQVFAAPRRLAVRINGLAEKAPDQDLVVTGPPEKVAFGEDGKPSKAAEAFAKKNGLAIDELQLEDTDKGKRLVHRATAEGALAANVVPAIINESLAKLPIPKRMRWGSSRVEFVRPVHWLVVLWGNDVLPAEVLGLQAGRESRGHRFHAPEAINIESPASYEQQLRDAKVIADYTARRALVKEQAEAQASAIKAVAVIDEDLLDEVTALVEWPVALTGKFEESFLEVPAEALISSMQEHQKYFPVVDNNGKLQPQFIFIANLESKDPAQVIDGNERVIRPRLADAVFFYETDLKTPLAERCKKLEKVVFQAKLGTVWDKSQRVAKLAESIAKTIGGNGDWGKRAAELAKADLVSDMVLEFGDLQGIAGSYYAEKDGEPAEVALAMKEQYLPKFAGDELPSSLTGAALALADRIDTMVGIFGINQPPTGSKDPFALRRAALGVIRIIDEKGFLALDLNELFAEAAANYSAVSLPNDSVEADVSAFVFERYRALYNDKGVDANTVIAVQNVLQGKDQAHNPHDVALRIAAVEAFSKLPEASALSAANKRVQNILAKQGGDAPEAAVDTSLLKVDAEKALHTQLQAMASSVPGLCDKREYTQALTELAQLKETVDSFFDDVMVMDEDESLRNNRINLLRELNRLFIRIADISQLQF